MAEHFMTRVLARSDNGANLTTGQLGGRAYFYGQDFYIQQLWISVGTAPTGATILVDVNLNGTTIFTTSGNRPSIAISGFASASNTVMEVTRIASGQYLTVDIDQIGSSVAGKDLEVVAELLYYA